MRQKTEGKERDMSFHRNDKRIQCKVICGIGYSKSIK